MRIRTQYFPNSFSLDNKNQKVVLPKTAPRASVLSEIDRRSQLTNWQCPSNHERFTRLAGISDKRRIKGRAYLRKPQKSYNMDAS
jgi:hypothetical protein